MRLFSKTLAAICTIAVGFGSGCRSQSNISRPSDDYISPLITLGSESYDQNVFVPESALTEDHSVSQTADCRVSFSQDSIGVRGDGAVISGKDIILSDGCFELTGESNNSKIIIDGDMPVTLLLNDIVLNSNETVIEQRGTGKLTITLTENSENHITADGCGISSNGDLTINGSGKLDISSNDNGINCSGTIKLCGGTIEIRSTENGIFSEQNIISSAGTIHIESDKDGIKAEHSNNNQLGYVNITGGSIDIQSDHDGISADSAVFINGGSVSLYCGGGSSAVLHRTNPNGHTIGKHGGYSSDGSTEFDFSAMVSGDGRNAGSKKGIRSNGIISMQKGSLDISSADDAVSAKSDIIISDISLNISTGDDAIYSHGSVYMLSGTINISKSFNAIEGMLVNIQGGIVGIHSLSSGISAAGGADINAWSNSDNSKRYISISDGEVTINSGGTGLDSAGIIAISGGNTVIFSKKHSSVDYRDYFTISNGKFTAFGNADSTKAPNLVSGSCISVYLTIENGKQFRVTDNNGKELFAAVLPMSCGSVIFYSNEIVSGNQYLLYADDKQISEVTAEDGVFGGGPDGSGAGMFEDINSDNFKDNEIAA